MDEMFKKSGTKIGSQPKLPIAAVPNKPIAIEKKALVSTQTLKLLAKPEDATTANLKTQAMKL